MRHAMIVATAALAFGIVGPSVGGEMQPDVQAPSFVVFGSGQAEGVLGKEVRSKSGQSMGRLIDVVVDRMGRPRAAVIDFGGFMGVGSRKIAIDWNSLRFESDGAGGDAVTTDITRDQVKNAPEYKDKRAVIVLGFAGGASPSD